VSDNAPSGAATAPLSDPFAGAKANLRETVKWLATVFAGLAAVVAAGASLTGVSQLKGPAQVVALAGAAVGLICVILAAGIMLRLLTTKTFFVSDLDNAEHLALRQFLDRHAVDFLPAEFPTVGAMLEARLNWTRDAYRFKDDQASRQYIEANKSLGELEPHLYRLTTLAQLESMRRDFNARIPWLFGLALGALLGLGVFAVYSTPAKATSVSKPCNCCCETTDTPRKGGDARPSPPVGALVTFDPGEKWRNVADVYTSRCTNKDKSRLIKAQILAPGQPDWVNIRLLEPKECEGIVVPVPAKTVIPAATLPDEQ
jgi:hypothetical protein